MALAPGTRLGPYEVSALIGVGGMGEVYAARDTNLKRSVAIKVLPEAFALDAERLARFQREAEVLASLNHPNIAQIHGLEKTAGATALVMELVEGPTLADRIARGPVPVDDALPIARQIAEALEAAHEQGIVHRDLKPANIKVKDDGTVKVLDFGLAKALAPEAAAASGGLLNSPTITSPAMTQRGVILGTAAYMSPEQARGKTVDRRTDIWAFGCVLFEMLTGKRAFPGEDISDTLAAILRGEPDWAALPVDTPAPLRRVIRRCLLKERKDRLGDLSAARLDIAEASGRTAVENGDAPRRVRAHIGPLLAAAILGATLATAAAWVLRPGASQVASPHLTIDLPAGHVFTAVDGPGIAISRDGRFVAYTTVEGPAPSRLLVRAIDRADAVLVQGADGAYGPFFSPDSREIGFFANGKLWRAQVTGGAAFQMASADPLDRGAAWAPDGFVYIGGESGVSRVPVSGGPREMLTRVDRASGQIAHRFPDVLPDGRAVVFTILRAGLDEARMGVLDLRTRNVRELDQLGHAAKYVATGHLVFLRAGALMALPFDLARLDAAGAPKPTLTDVAFGNGGAGHFGVSETGTLVFVPGREMVRALPVWADRSGRMEPVGVRSDAFGDAALSPDGGRLALVREERSGSERAGSNVVIWDFARRSSMLLTRNAATFNTAPVWMPDGDTVIFASRPRGIGSPSYLFRASANAAGQPTRISPKDIEGLGGNAGQRPGAVSTDGAHVFFDQVQTRDDGLHVLQFGASQAQVIKLRSEAVEPRISPDGRWLAYVQSQSGDYRSHSDVWVQPYPDATGSRGPISTQGGMSPRWSRDSRELFYRAGTTMMVATIDSRTGFASVRPRVVFDAPGTSSRFDVSADGQRFLMLRIEPPPEQVPHVILNWFEELKVLVPEGK